MTDYTVAVVVERDESGYYAECPSLQGCYAQGATYEEVMTNLTDAIVLHIQDREANGEAVDVPQFISVATLRISA